ncbi:aminopeptidase [Flavobacterium sp.]|uniref:aminopeptidase n=1 Tax=Flavobacterium sp. TaxID=239 RepID=UPI0038D232D2
MKLINYIVLLCAFCASAQHQSKLVVAINYDNHSLYINQELTYFNQSKDTLSSIVLNDWNNAYSSNATPLGARFSDEFVRSFLFASEKERGSTTINLIADDSNVALNWNRPDGFPDLIRIELKNKLAPGEKARFTLSYQLKLPDDKFTGYGYNSDGDLTLKNWFLTPALYTDSGFVTYNNLNIDDAPNALTDVDLIITDSKGYSVISDLILEKKENNNYHFVGKNQFSVHLFIQKKNTFLSFKNKDLDVTTNLEGKLDEINKALLIDKVIAYTEENLGKYPKSKITVSESDYEQNPFYGLNQLPSFINPFTEDYIYEMKFLKTYLNNYLKTTLKIDPRKDNWIFDAIQIYYLMKYSEENYPNAKMMGSIYKFKILHGYNLVSLDFNEQYSYFYMLMARKNLDQPLGDPKNTLIKFNEKIASKYKAGLSFKYLADYIGAENLEKAIATYLEYSYKNSSDSEKLQSILKASTSKDIDWFFDTLIKTRKTIDYKFTSVKKTSDSVSFQIKNKSNAWVPIPVYGIKNKQIVFKEWISKVKEDSIYTFKREQADKLVINFQNIVPEFNRRNNWKNLKDFSLLNKPIKFTFMKDLEDPKFNQVLYLPSLEYNLYDGFIAGICFHNKTLLDRPFNFDVTPSYSTTAKSFSGRFTFALNQFNRESNLYQIRYGLSGENYHYAPDAFYKKINPYVLFKLRDSDYRLNHYQNVLIRQVYLYREPSNFVKSSLEENYSIFNVRYSNVRNEVAKHFAYTTDLQLASYFGKASTSISYRKLFNNNRQVNLRLYAGIFMYNKTDSNYFSFALDRPTDYLFDYSYLGRNESTGIYSQEFIQAEGGFKSKLNQPYANSWITTVNGSFNIWNWIEVYGDFGILKSKEQDPHFKYDSGIRLNLVTDYFELYFPIQSSNGLELTQTKYSEKIRFVLAFSPQALIGLFTRKWF